MVKYGATISFRRDSARFERARRGLPRGSSGGNISECTTPRPAVIHCTSPRPGARTQVGDDVWIDGHGFKPRWGCWGKPGPSGRYIRQPSLRTKSLPTCRPANSGDRSRADRFLRIVVLVVRAKRKDRAWASAGQAEPCRQLDSPCFELYLRWLGLAAKYGKIDLECRKH